MLFAGQVWFTKSDRREACAAIGGHNTGQGQPSAAVANEGGTQAFAAPQGGRTMMIAYRPMIIVALS